MFRSSVKRVQILGEDGDKETAIRRNILLTKLGEKGLRTSPIPGQIETLVDILQAAPKSFGNNRCIGWRELIEEYEEERVIVDSSGGEPVREVKKFKLFELGPYKWITSHEFLKLVHNASSGLASLGVKKGDKIMIYAKTSHRWLQFAHACWERGAIIVTAYEALDNESLRSTVNEVGVTMVFTDSGTFKKLAYAIKGQSTIKAVIYCTESDYQNVKESHPDFVRNLECITLETLEKRGYENLVPAEKVASDDICCIMYTSGTTGGSKGVVLSHGNLVAAVAGAQTVVEGLEAESDSYLAYLPLSHVLECVIESVCLFYGIPIGFGSVWTLTNDFVKNCNGDFIELRPSVIAGVPAVWESIKRGIIKGVEEQPLIRRVLFKFFFHLKWLLMLLGVSTKFIDSIVFKKVQDKLGGRFRFVLNGGAPVHASTKKFITICLTNVINGYGLTETTGMGAIQFHEDFTCMKTVGVPTAAVEVKLVSVEGTPHQVNDPHNPTGEIWIRGPPVMKGYFNQPELTAEVLTSDGWLKTGDIGRWAKDGTLQIVDRMKNLVKLDNGEYISLEKLESLYRSSKYVENVCVFCKPHVAFVVAIISPVEAAIVSLAEKLGIIDKDQKELDIYKICKNSSIIGIIHEDIKSLATSSGFSRIEIPKKISIEPGKWTPESGHLTAAFKISRSNLAAKYNNLLSQMLS